MNDFVVLARYHFYDGLAVTHIEPQGWFDVGLTLGGGQAATAPGFTIPDEVPPQGQIFTAGTIAMTGTPGRPGTNRGALLFATFENAPNIDQGVTSFGIMLDGQSTLTAINAAASADGQPTEAITIRSITVTEAGPISS